MKLYKDYTKEPLSFLLNDTTLPSNNPFRFRKNLLQRRLLVKKPKESITKTSKIKFSTIQTDKPLRFWHYHQEMLVYMNFGQVKMFYKKKIGRKNCYNKKDSIFTIRK